MELTAVIKAFEYVKAQAYNFGEIVVYSDSQYVVQLYGRKKKLQRNNFRTKKGKPIQNTDLVERLICLMGTIEIRFVKVKAHQKKTESLNYNREVDKLARKLLRELR